MQAEYMTRNWCSSYKFNHSATTFSLDKLPLRLPYIQIKTFSCEWCEIQIPTLVLATERQKFSTIFPFETAAAERTLMFDPKIPETPENLGTGNSSESPQRPARPQKITQSIYSNYPRDYIFQCNNINYQYNRCIPSVQVHQEATAAAATTSRH